MRLRIVYDIDMFLMFVFFFFQAEDGIRDKLVTGVQTCALPISPCFAPGVSQQQGTSAQPPASPRCPSTPRDAPRPGRAASGGASTPAPCPRRARTAPL